MMRLWPLLLIVLSVTLTACHGKRMSDHVIVQNEAFTLTGDSLIEGGIIATASTPLYIESSLTHERLDSIANAFAFITGNEGRQPAFTGGKPWHADDINTSYLQLNTQQQLLNALHNMSIDYIEAASTGSTFDAHGDTIGLYCAIYLSLAHLDPVRSKNTLRLLTRDGVIAPCGDWPSNASRLAWATAAWEVYTATGDHDWLTFMHNVIDNTLRLDCRIMQDFSCDLMHGSAGQRPSVFYPAWMQPIDVIETMPLCTNVIVLRALEIMEEIDDELGPEHDHEANAQRLKSAINQHLWSERRGRYSAYLYGSVTALRAPIVDNLAQSLAVLWNIADDDRASTLIKKTPVTHFGIPVIYPWTSAVEPYFSHSTWPALQALWTLAAANVGNEDMVRRGMAALYRAQALFQSRQITTTHFRPNNLLCAAGNQAILLRVIAGLHFLPDGLEIAPMVPACMPGDKTITNLQYRGAILDITISGTGNDVKEITLDNQPMKTGFLPASITGHHKVHVTLQRGRTTNGATITMGNVMLAPTPDLVWTPDSGCIVNYVAGGRYVMFADGRFNHTIGSMTFALPHSANTTEISVAMGNKYGFGFMAQPQLVTRSVAIEFNVRDSVWTDTTTVNIAVAHGGHYILQADYDTEHGGPCDVRLLDVNTHPKGALFMPSAQEPSASNRLDIDLLKGNNRLVFTRPKEITATAHPVTLRLIKR
ncbi:MAG: hypothetical protein J5565_03380 [Muribaculaceae bacterium]|nr:hypothetical protein [Muribaculaceae bacterium]